MRSFNFEAHPESLNLFLLQAKINSPWVKNELFVKRNTWHGCEKWSHGWLDLQTHEHNWIPPIDCRIVPFHQQSDISQLISKRREMSTKLGIENNQIGIKFQYTYLLLVLRQRKITTHLCLDTLLSLPHSFMIQDSN